MESEQQAHNLIESSVTVWSETGKITGNYTRCTIQLGVAQTFMKPQFWDWLVGIILVPLPPSVLHMLSRPTDASMRHGPGVGKGGRILTL